jgi:hypothetical protein
VAKPRRDGTGNRGGETALRHRVAAIPEARRFAKPANDNRRGIKGWAPPVIAGLGALGIAALVLAKILG